MTKQKMLDRYGGMRKLRGLEAMPDIGQAILHEGPGGGFASYPWILDKYERALGLTVGETWLLKRMLAHAWTFAGCAFISLRKAARQSKPSYTSVYRWCKSLRDKGLIVPTEHKDKGDRRVSYDVRMTYAALALCIACDPVSKFSRANGGAMAVEEGGRIGVGVGLHLALETLADRGGDDVTMTSPLVRDDVTIASPVMSP